MKYSQMMAELNLPQLTDILGIGVILGVSTDEVLVYLLGKCPLLL